jgi:hypothetical protein
VDIDKLRPMTTRAGHRFLTSMLERLYSALSNGPTLNCRPGNSRQRLELCELKELQHLVEDPSPARTGAARSRVGWGSEAGAERPGCSFAPGRSSHFVPNPEKALHAWQVAMEQQLDKASMRAGATA